MKTVVFLGFDEKRGLTYHFTDWILAMDKAIDDKLQLVLVTFEKEQNPNLHSKLRNLQSIDIVTIENTDDLSDLRIFKNADIMHCHGFKQVARVLKIKKTNKLKFKTIITMHSFRHGTWLRPFYANIVSFLYMNKIDVAHFFCHTSKDEFLKYNVFYKHSNRSYVFPMGCNKEEFLTDEPIQNLEFYKELNENKKNIVYLANFSKVKEQLWLIRFIKDILIQEKAKLWLFGEGAERKKTIKYVEEKGLSPYVKLPGRVDRRFIPTILKKMDLAVCTSKSETFGHLIVEPIFAGIPVVTFNVGTAGYLIRDFTTGFIIKDRSDRENFRKAVEFLLKNRNIALMMGKNARLFANQWLTWNITTQNTLNMYFSMLKEEGRGRENRH